MNRFPLASSSWDEAERDALQRVIASDRFTMGPEVAAFEAEFARFAGSRHAVMVNSGSSANLAMVAALRYRQDPASRLMPGDQVIVPAVSWSTSFFPLHQYGLHLKFVDIDRETLNYDLAALAAAIDDRTRAVMAVNLLGNPNDFDAIRSLIGTRRILLIEDNCESMGATFAGRQAGTFGVMGTFSTFFSHHISTMEGGLVVTDDEELYHILLALRAHGWTRDLPRRNRVTGEKGEDPFEESFRFVLPGYNLRPLEMSGALGRAQLEKLPRLVAARRAMGRGDGRSPAVPHPARDRRKQLVRLCAGAAPRMQARPARGSGAARRAGIRDPAHRQRQFHRQSRAAADGPQPARADDPCGRDRPQRLFHRQPPP
ncbi:aminotransferase class I/II-fold pyridoxal phosphate-dependent enzyme [Paracoccus sp. pheM1]|uniref:DegT/DnrJ/EryC1/StrS family aminotransferase n=1 Tax=Paracoccus sp. pheM1 TaxID=2831675 RepID=UPI001F0B481B|nr:aminotransferase class I/II-fold pyridoxal phosphate-dependent enzyme [Paracoccus sp. pheM1]